MDSNRLVSTAVKVIPASYGQEQLWFLEQLEPSTPLYNIVLGYRIRGQVDTVALEAALNAFVARHESFRTTLRDIDGRPMQVIHTNVKIRLNSLLAREPGLAGAIVAAQDHARVPFDPRTAPLLRAAICRFAPDAHLLALTIHHSIFDGWSVSILNREVGLLYSHARGLLPEEPRLPALQFSDFTRWERAFVDANADTQARFWAEHLAPPLPKVDLFAKQLRSRTRSLEAGQTRIDVVDLTRLRDVCKTEGITPFVAALSAFILLLKDYGGQRDLLLGLPVLNRDLPGADEIVGFLTNTLALRFRLRPQMTGRDLFSFVRGVTLDGMERSSFPLARVVQTVGPERDTTQSPLFQVLFNYELPPDELRLAGCYTSPVDLFTNVTKFDLTLTVRENDDNLSCCFEYRLDTLDPPSGERLAQHFRQLFTSLIENPQDAIDHFELLTPEERALVTNTWNATASRYTDCCVHELFEQQVRAFKRNVAVVSETEAITYSQLNQRANQMARRLRSLGVGQDQVIGLCVERSVDMVIALIAILKAGAAYLPLDADYPRERLNYMMDNARVQTLVVSDRFAQLFARPQHIVKIDGDRALLDAEPGEDLGRTAEPADLAYVLYTSGSTGRPKGVCIEHRNVTNYARAIAERIGFRPSQRHLMVQPLSVDSSVTMLFGALLSGGTLELASRASAVDPQRLAALMQSRPPDYLKIAPSHLDALRHSAQYDFLPKTALILGGEASTLAWTRGLAAERRCRVFNHYGPTETTVGVTTYEVAPSDDSGSATTPLGRPLANIAAYVVDKDLRLRPPGVAGELVIAGAAVGRGYLGRADLTAERFIPDPFGRIPGARLYRTGDAARFMADGTIEFLGRGDDQVKIRGYRVELGEIEAVLREHPAVRAAVVVVQRAANGARLVAHVETSSPSDVNGLHSWLAQRLPEYMVPTVRYSMQLPRSAQGKIDRSALPAVTFADEPALESLTPTERVISAIWMEMLGCAPAPADDFFELGGHSLLAMRLIARIEDECRVRLSVRTVFDSSSLRDLSREVDAAARSAP
jgi:amino acid adenylation domain-containing protein